MVLTLRVVSRQEGLGLAVIAGLADDVQFTAYHRRAQHQDELAIGRHQRLTGHRMWAGGRCADISASRSTNVITCAGSIAAL